MLWPKKNSYKEFDNEKKFLRLENSHPPPPPITFLLGSLLLNNTLMPQVPTFVNVQVATSLISHILLHRKETKKKTLIQCRLIYFIKATEKI